MLSTVHPAQGLWVAYDILCRDNNYAMPRDALELLSWLLFMKLDDERDHLQQGDPLSRPAESSPIVGGRYRWSAWIDKALGMQLLPTTPRVSPQWTSTELADFVGHDLMPHLAALKGTPERDLLSALLGQDRNPFHCESPENLRAIIALIDLLDFKNKDARAEIALVYEALLLRLGNEAVAAGIFPTPEPILCFAVKILAPQLAETVYDPSCGFCSFLVQAHAYRSRLEPSQPGPPSPRYTGLEKNLVVAFFGLVNMLLHGVSSFSILRSNALQEDVSSLPATHYDVILSNPFTAGREHKVLQHNVPIPTRAADLLWLQHCMQKLAPQERARCCLVVPEGLLFRNGIYATVKEQLLRDFTLSFVVRLPSGAFAPYSDNKMALLFFERPGPTTQVLFYEVPPPPGHKQFSKRVRIEERHFDGAYEAWVQWRRMQSGAGSLLESNSHLWVATREQIAALHYDLTASRPLQAPHEVFFPTPEALITRIMHSHQRYLTLITGLHHALPAPSNGKGSPEDRPMPDSQEKDAPLS
jgi:type I restriction enzyme M protein